MGKKRPAGKRRTANEIAADLARQAARSQRNQEAARAARRVGKPPEQNPPNWPVGGPVQ